MARAKRASAQALALPANLDLTQAGELAKTLGAARGSNIAVDASGVQRVGTQCLQVLLAAKAAAPRSASPAPRRASSKPCVFWACTPPFLTKEPEP